MNRIHPHSLGLALGVFFATMHVIWSLLVLFGIAKWWLDIVFKLHMLTPIITVTGFSLTKVIFLVIGTGLVGYVAGWLLGVIWNRYAVK